MTTLFVALDLQKPIDYDQAYRLGFFNPKRTRSILVSFIRQEDRDLVFSLRTSLQRSANHYNVWINEDITPESRRGRNVLREVSKEAKGRGAKASSTPHSVTINSKRFDSSNIEALPVEYSLENIKTKQLQDPKKGAAVIAYHSEHAPFSNLYPCVIVIGDRDFLSVEQVLQYKKAKRMKAEEVARKILLSRDVYEIRQMGKDLGTSKEWEGME